MDQASRLRSAIIKKSEYANEESTKNNDDFKTRIICITSGKGGVGKSNVTLNLALAVAAKGSKVAILDADLGLANIEILLGIRPKHGLLDLLEEDFEMKDIMEDGPLGIKIISGGSGISELANLSLYNLNKILNSIYDLRKYVDYIFIDTGAGLSESVVSFINASEEIIVVTNPEPTCIADAYAIIKRINNFSEDKKINLIVNRVIDKEEGLSTYKRLNLVGEKFLGRSIKYLGHISDDRNVKFAVKAQTPFYLQYPKTDASENLERICDIIINEYEFKEEESKIGNFVKKLSNFFLLKRG